MQKVELHQAFQWTCKECGYLNFVVGITAELTPEERAELRRQLNVGEDQEFVADGGFIMAPTEVQCHRCRTEFKVDTGEDESADPTEPFPKS